MTSYDYLSNSLSIYLNTYLSIGLSKEFFLIFLPFQCFLVSQFKKNNFILKALFLANEDDIIQLSIDLSIYMSIHDVKVKAKNLIYFSQKNANSWCQKIVCVGLKNLIFIYLLFSQVAQLIYNKESVRQFLVCKFIKWWTFIMGCMWSRECTSSETVVQSTLLLMRDLKR